MQGTTILVEANHLLACQRAAEDDADLHCDFSTASASTTPSEVDTICNKPSTYPDDVQRACQAAEEAVTFPGAGTGLYERMLDQLIYAGAPYSNDWFGLLLGTDYLFPKNLLDFNNMSTVTGYSVPQNCTSLTSMALCGWLYGPYYSTFPSSIDYRNYPNEGETGTWKPATAEQLVDLLDPFNAESADGFNVSGTLADYMVSIGFDLEVQNGLIITTANTGTNGISGDTAICFMDTAAPRDKTKQPLCDQESIKVEGTDNLLKTGGRGYVEKDWTKSLASNPSFYKAEINIETTPEIWTSVPGWLASEQAGTIYWQYHWPVLDVTKLSCSLRVTNLNPGGAYTMCGRDLQAYIDALLPPPDTATSALMASADSTLDSADRNRNLGADLRHELVAFGDDRSNDMVVRFHEDAIERFRKDGNHVSATLKFTVDESLSDLDVWNDRVTVLPLPAPFVEGNGDAVDRGIGTGATWHCAADADVGDDARTCAQRWTPDRWALPRRHGAPQLDAEVTFDEDGSPLVRMSWDVTEDVLAGVNAWILRKPTVRPGGALAFYSQEGALERRQSTWAPRLLLQR